MYCTHCGTQLPDNASFCPSCGHKQTAKTTVKLTIETNADTKKPPSLTSSEWKIPVGWVLLVIGTCLAAGFVYQIIETAHLWQYQMDSKKPTIVLGMLCGAVYICIFFITGIRFIKMPKLAYRNDRTYIIAAILAVGLLVVALAQAMMG